MPRKKPAPKRRGWGAWSVDYHTATKRWRVRPPASVDPKRRPTYFDDPDEARQWAEAERVRNESLSPGQDRDITLGTWTGRWYNSTLLAADWTVRTQKVYRDHLWHWSRLYLIRLRDLKQGDIKDVIGKLRTVGAEERPITDQSQAWRVKRRPLSAKVIRDSLRTLARALESARDDGYLDKNPAAGVVLPAVRQKSRVIWTLKQRRQLVAELEREPLYPLFVLLFTCGLRIGEALALKWSDFDREARTVTIQRTIHKGHVQEWPKNGKARLVQITSYAWAALLRHRDSGELTGAVWIFTREDGKPIDYARVRKRLMAACKRAGVEYLPTHTMRHSHVSELMAGGIMPSEIAERIGHTGLSTLPRYTHATGATADRILELADSLVRTENGENGDHDGDQSAENGEPTR